MFKSRPIQAPIRLSTPIPNAHLVHQRRKGVGVYAGGTLSSRHPTLDAWTGERPREPEVELTVSGE